MKHFFKVLFLAITISILASNCARKGRPSGGLKDSIAPVMVTANPPYKSINFSSKKIKISFDEYIILKNINQQLIISPPLKFLPTITPQGSASEDITIRLTDTLKENTTYTFNFGNSIQDNNEGNSLTNFKYIFSTGNYIDSLETRGTVKDAYKKDFDKSINVLLYKVDSTYTDSIIYKKKPTYIANTIDSTLFNLTNTAKGKYLLVALKEVSNNYLFNPKEDKIGFYDRFIELPEDSVIKKPIALFKEIPVFKLSRPKQINKGRILFGYQGDGSKINIELLSEVPLNFESISKFEPKKDTLNYWHSAIQNDSLNFKVSTATSIDTLTVYLRNKVIDSLKVNSNISGTLALRDTLTLTTNNPVKAIDTSLISLFTKDSVQVPFSPIKRTKNNDIHFVFDKKYNEKYHMRLLPKALTDIFETHNDSLNYQFKTTEPEDYGSISLSVNNASSSGVIIELLKEQSRAVVAKKILKKGIVKFDLLPPGNYLVRAIHDVNNNSKWDTGSYLLKRQPEKVIYHPIVFKINANWHLPAESITIE